MNNNFNSFGKLYFIMFVTIILCNAVITTLGNEEDAEDGSSVPGNLSFTGSISSLPKTLTKDANSIRGCCRREKKIKKVGLAISGEEVKVDVGHCKKKCSNQKPLKKKRFEELLLKHPSMDPREVFLRHSLRHKKRRPSCPKGEICTETEHRIEKIQTAEGEVTIDVVEGCSCQTHQKQCQRHPKLVTFHKGTPLETVLDMGECKGSCGEDRSCKPIVTKTRSVEGPNGAECVEVVEDCECSSECYRVSHFKQVYDYTQGDPVAQVIDVGKCLGACATHRREHCVLREENNDNCLMSINESAASCLPLKLQETLTTDKYGQTINITSVITCGCI